MIENKGPGFPGARRLAGAFVLSCLAAGATTVALADGGPEHQGQSVRPIELGVTGGSIEHIIDKAFAYCYTGTLGALVQDANGQYVLSNNHVLAKENEPDNGLAPDGNNIIQPGLLDEGSCTLSLGDSNNIVAYLTDYVWIEFGKGRNPPANSVDAAIAITNDAGSGTGGMVRTLDLALRSRPSRQPGPAGPQNIFLRYAPGTGPALPDC